MFETYALWRKLKPQLEQQLGGKFSALKSAFKATLSSAFDDLVSVLKEHTFNTNIWQHVSEAQVVHKTNHDVSKRYVVFPIFALENSAELSKKMAEKIEGTEKYRKLNVKRTNGGIGNEDWNNILKIYFADLLKYALPSAIKQMVEDKKNLYTNYYVIDYTEREAITVEDVPGNHKIVVLYQASSKNEVSQAKNIWKKRTNSSYEYKLEDYKGFRAR